MLTRRAFFGSLAASSLVRPASRPANVVMFMTDDHGAWANGVYGCSGMRTPNIDKLAQSGVRFTNAFAATPVCSPSRMTWATGLLPSSHGVQDWLVLKDSTGQDSRDWLGKNLTWFEVLKREGYRLGMTGKWHMGQDEKAQRGFSYWATVPGGGGTYRNPEFVVNGEKRRYEGFKEDAIGDYATEFIGQQNAATPFGLLVPFYAPHTPFDYQPEDDRAPYNDSSFGCFPDLPPHPRQNKGLRNHHGNRASKQAYSALITALDRNIGRILAKLEEKGLRQNTLVIFTADQGWNAGHHGLWGKGNGSVPFNMYEESIRVPLIWNHPGRLPAGRTVDGMVSSYDFFPSLLDFLGFKAPEDKRRPGRSCLPLIRGQRIAWRDRLYFEYAYVRSVRTAKRKYVERTGGWPSELWDLEMDPGETANVIDDPARAQELDALRKDLRGFFQRLGAPPLSEWRSTTQQNLTVYSL